MAHVISVKVTELRIGTVMAEGKKRFPVKTLTPCKHKRRGIPKVHVNEKLCYDTVGYVDVVRD